MACTFRPLNSNERGLLNAEQGDAQYRNSSFMDSDDVASNTINTLGYENVLNQILCFRNKNIAADNKGAPTGPPNSERNAKPLHGNF